MGINVLPSDIASEKAIFSILLNQPEKFIEIMDLLIPSDFSSTAHQEIWKACSDLFKNNQELDMVSIRTQLQKQDIDPRPVLMALSECYEEQVLSGNLLSFISEVKNKSLLRQIIRATKTHTQTAQLDNANAETILSTIEKDILQITDRSRGTRPVDAAGIIQEITTELKTNQEQGWKGLYTGFPKLDNHTGGLIPTQSWIVGAYTGVGKTFLLLQMILNILRGKGKVVLFSTEMDRKMNMLRLLGNMANLGSLQILRGELLDEEEEALQKAKEELRSYKDSLTIYDNVRTVDDIRLKTKKLKITTGVDIAVIDFIQNLKGSENLYERMSTASVDLQEMAQDLFITNIIGSQISQAAAGWQSKEAIEFKGAGEIAAIADVALWMTKTNDPSQRILSMRKLRHGASGKFDLKIAFPSGRITGLEKEVPEEKEGSVTEQLII